MKETGGVFRRLCRGVERAMVGEHVRTDRKDLAVLGRRHFALHDVVTGKRCRHEILGTVLDPLHRPTSDDRADRGQDVAGVDTDFVAEPTADVRRDDADLVFGDAGDDREQRPVGVRGLRRLVERQPAFDRFEVRNGTAGFHRCRVNARIDNLLSDDDVCRSEDRLGFCCVSGLPVEDVVVGLALDVVTDDGRIGVQGLAGIDDRSQHVVLDVDEFNRIAGGVTILGDDERDLLTLEAHLVSDEHGLHVGREGGRPRELETQEVLAGDDSDHAGVRQRPGGIN